MDTTQQISIHKAIWAIPLATLACVALLTGTWFMSDMMARHPDQLAWSLCLLALPLFPLVSVLQLALMWHSALRALLRGGIEWRGTFYSLSTLRAGR